MSGDLHSVGPVADRRFSARPSHVAGGTGREMLHQLRRDARDSVGW